MEHADLALARGDDAAIAVLHFRAFRNEPLGHTFLTRLFVIVRKVPEVGSSRNDSSAAPDRLCRMAAALISRGSEAMLMQSAENGRANKWNTGRVS